MIDCFDNIIFYRLFQTGDKSREREQYLFRSTKFGDAVDRTLKKSDGSWTYFAADVGYHAD